MVEGRVLLHTDVWWEGGFLKDLAVLDDKILVVSVLGYRCIR